MEDLNLKTTFEYLYAAVHTEDGWIHPLRDVVSDVKADEAAWKPAADVASIQEVVAHATPYLFDVLHALRGEEAKTHDDWKPVDEPSEAAWISLRDELISGIDELNAEIAKLHEKDLGQPPASGKSPRWEMLTDVCVHNAYHAGQVVKLKQLYASMAHGAKQVVAV